MFESESVMIFTIQAVVVDYIIGDLLFHPDDVEGVTHARAMSIFKLHGTRYQVEEKNPSRFRLCFRFMSRGASFRMAALLMDDTKEKKRQESVDLSDALKASQPGTRVSLGHVSRTPFALHLPGMGVLVGFGLRDAPGQVVR